MPKDSSALAAWKTAARIAWHDTRRNLVSTVLALLIMIIPASALVSITAWDEASNSSSRLREAADYGGTLGSLGYSPQRIYERIGETSRVTPYIPGDQAGTNFTEVTTALEEFTGLELLPFDVDTLGGRPIARTTTTADLPGKATLTSGRWPRSSTEMVVTQAGIDAGLPASGSAVLGDGRTYTIVGLGRAYDSTHSPPLQVHAVTLPTNSTTIKRWLIVGDPNQSLSNTDTLDNWYGYNLTISTPGPPLLSVRWFRDYWFEDGVGFGLLAMVFLLLLLVMVLIVIGLVISPAFTIRAARLRDQLHNLARTGATAKHLRSVVIMQGLIQGLVATVVSVGIAVAYVVIRGTTTPAAKLPFGGVDYRAVVWPCLLLGSAVVACALVASFVPALNVTKSGALNASGAGHTPQVRDDFLGLSARASLRLSLSLLTIGSLGISIAIFAAAQMVEDQHPIYPVFLFGIVAVSTCAASVLAGLIYLVPVVLSWLSTKSSLLPCAPRQSLRILTRTKGPSVAIILSVTVVTAVTGTVTLFNTWTTTQNDRDIHSVLPADGEELIAIGAKLGKYDEKASDALSANGFAYHKVYTPITYATNLDGDSMPPAPNANPTSYDNLLAPTKWPHAKETMKSPQNTGWDTTHVVLPHDGPGAQALILDEHVLTARFAFSPKELEDLRAGTMFAYGTPPTEDTESGTDLYKSRTLTLHKTGSAPVTIPWRPAPHTTSGLRPDNSRNQDVVYFASKSGMEQLGITVHPYGWLLTSHNDSPMSSANYRRAHSVLNQTTGSPVNLTAYASLDTGDTTEDLSVYRNLPIQVIAGILVLLILTMTILSTYESRTAHNTISALGGTNTHVRNYVGVGAFTTSLCGTAIGFMASMIVVLPAAFTLYLIGQRAVDMSAWVESLVGLALVFLVAVPLTSTLLAWLLSPVATTARRSPST